MIRIDQTIFEEHFRAHFTPLCRYAHAFVKDYTQSKEIVQDVFTRIWEKKEDLVIKENLRVYLYKMVRNKALNFLRDDRSRYLVREIPEMSTTDETDVVDEKVVDVQGMLNTLPHRCREIFILKRIKGLSYKQISAQLSISEKSVENQMTIAFRKLREGINGVEPLGEI